MTARRLAKSVLYHARRARIRALAAPRRLPWLRRRLHLPSNDTFDPLRDASPDVRVVRLTGGETFTRPLPELGDAPAAACAFFADRTRETSTPAYVAEFTDGIAWGHGTGGVFTKDGRFVPAFTHDPCGADFHTVWTRTHLPRPQRTDGSLLYLVTPEAGDNFHHWMIDLLPRLGRVRAAGWRLEEFDHVLVNHASRRYQLATLARLGISPARIIRADDALHLRARRLVVPSLKPENQTAPSADLAFLRQVFLPAEDVGRPRRRIFLSRNDAGFRKLSNEAELRPLLEAHGFEIVAPATLSIEAQARLFAEAAIIAGPSGAAFANLAFATPGAHVIEIAPPGWLAPYHWMLSARIGLSHTIVLGEGPVMRGVPDVSARERDIVVDPRRFAAALEPILSAIPAATA
ncbi:MAG TPA: glycosyltransferase family 61 protein [Opitutus sp.]|nr:glycosyltransferase family 61 protein [Opitutus sp.]